ncbi:MAG: metallophosphoesterase [bacterium]
MKIGVISDTHDNAKKILEAIKIFNNKSVDLVVHCGDWVSPFLPDFCKDLNCKIISVYGNNEGDKTRFKQRLAKNNWNIEFNEGIKKLVLGGKRIAVYHGHDKKLLADLFNAQKYDIVLSGHTHKPVVENINGVLHINPGTISGTRESELINEYTIAIYETNNNEAEIINL